MASLIFCKPLSAEHSLILVRPHSCELLLLEQPPQRGARGGPEPGAAVAGCRGPRRAPWARRVVAAVGGRRVVRRGRRSRRAQRRAVVPGAGDDGRGSPGSSPRQVPISPFGAGDGIWCPLLFMVDKNSRCLSIPPLSPVIVHGRTDGGTTRLPTMCCVPSNRSHTGHLRRFLSTATEAFMTTCLGNSGRCVGAKAA